MTLEDFKEWNNQDKDIKRHRLKQARINLGLTQIDIGDRLRHFGYQGGRSTVGSWERGITPIPPLVFELIKENFRVRK